MFNFLFFCGAGYRNVQLVKLLLLDNGGSAHHDILRVLVHREGDDLADGILACEQHDHTVNARGDAGMGRRTVTERVVHCRELGLDIVLAEADHLEGLYHDLGIVVTNSARGQLDAVAYEIVLECGDRQRVDLAALCLFKDLKAAVWH